MVFRLRILALLTAGAAGCGDSSVGRVAGRVTLDGEPAPGLEVEFNPVADGRGSIGYTGPDGGYNLQYTLQTQGAVVGSHVVRVRVPPESDTSIRVPARYGHKSELRYDVSPGSNRYDIEMVSASE